MVKGNESVCFCELVCLLGPIPKCADTLFIHSLRFLRAFLEREASGILSFNEIHDTKAIERFERLSDPTSSWVPIVHVDSHWASLPEVSAWKDAKSIDKHAVDSPLHVIAVDTEAYLEYEAVTFRISWAVYLHLCL